MSIGDISRRIPPPPPRSSLKMNGDDPVSPKVPPPVPHHHLRSKSLPQDNFPVSPGQRHPPPPPSRRHKSEYDLKLSEIRAEVPPAEAPDSGVQEQPSPVLKESVDAEEGHQESGESVSRALPRPPPKASALYKRSESGQLLGSPDSPGSEFQERKSVTFLDEQHDSSERSLDAVGIGDSKDSATDLRSPRSPSSVSLSCRKQGLLVKRGAMVKNWKERHFVLKENELLYYKDQKTFECGLPPQGKIPLRGLVTKLVDEKEYGKKYAFALISAIQKRTYIVVASSLEERGEWIRALDEMNFEPLVVSGSSSSSSSSLRRSVYVPCASPEGKVIYKNIETGEVAEERPAELEQEMYNQAARLFNQNQKKGLQYLEEKGLAASGDAQAMARFFKIAKGLSKRVVGDYFGSDKPFCVVVLQKYTELLNFIGFGFEEALREFLSLFRLPGEAQKIDRIIQIFAEKYHHDNPSIFSSAETAYILSFSTIMLNTDLHNPSVHPSKKMTLEAWIKNNQGIDNGQNVDREFLKSIYQGILSHQLKLKEDDQHHGDAITFLAASREGWLKKRGERGTQKRWFLLMDNNLYYFTKPEDVKAERPRCIYPLEDVKVIEKEDDNGFQLEPVVGLALKSCKKLENGDLVPGSVKSLLLFASSAAERDEWVRAIRDSSTGATFASIITRRKMMMQIK